ncbi:radical SAM protein [Anaerospora hongkongensis]|uniref:radical SAM protein n=1 Tax=Anaerospora hongkongensis TaxID=244830 RepID=UPI002898E202|nr:radical SAM protein [Anaerospora hongkongensis]
MSIDYIPLTERCNMSCAHCMVDAKVEGRDMSWETYVQAINVSMNEPIITLGGGEPTLHPHFMEMLEYAIRKRPKGAIVSIITNGSNTAISLKLADMTENGIISAALSQDQWHDPIDEVVVARFKDIGKIHTPAKTNKDVVSVGRGANIEGAIDKCVSRSLSIDTEGNLFLCGCEEECIGTIWDYTVPEIHCEKTNPIVESGEFICAGYCSKRGHVIVKNPEFFRALAEKARHKVAITKAKIAVSELYEEFDDSNLNPGEVVQRLEQCAMEAKELTTDEFLSIVEEEWSPVVRYVIATRLNTN